MSHDILVQSDLEKEMEETEKAIIMHGEIVENLRERRYELIAMKQDLEISEVIECIIENGLSAKEVMDVLSIAVARKRAQGEVPFHDLAN